MRRSNLDVYLTERRFTTVGFPMTAATPNDVLQRLGFSETAHPAERRSAKEKRPREDVDLIAELNKYGRLSRWRFVNRNRLTA